MNDDFKNYSKQIVKNAKVLASELQKLGYRIVSNGTDTHLLLVDLKHSIGITGAEAEKVLNDAGITCNKNTIPNDSERPMVTSGIRLGTPAMTSRGFKGEQFILVAHYIDEILKARHDQSALKKIRAKIVQLTNKFPLPY